MLEHKPFVFLSAIVLVLAVVLTLGVSRLVGAPGEPPPLRQSAATSLGPNLLANPSLAPGSQCRLRLVWTINSPAMFAPMRRAIAPNWA
jgi:hypothetical protein